MKIEISPLKTRPFLPPRDDVSDELLKVIPPLQEKDIIVVTSKVVAIDQGRCVSVNKVDKNYLIAQEADAFVPAASSRYGLTLAIKNNTLIASAGIDESNGNGYYILWPTDPSQWAKEFRKKLILRDSIKELGIIISDSHCIPLRRGIVGMSIGFHGVNPFFDYRNSEDIFGRIIQMTQANVVETITTAAVGIMGEGSECTPLVLVRDWPNVEFSETAQFSDTEIKPEDDIFAPLLKEFYRERDN